MDVTFVAVVSHQGDGLSLYAYLDGYFPFIDNNDWAVRLVADTTLVDDSVVVGNPLLRLGQQLSFCLNHYSEEAVDIGWQLLWQNDALFAVHKPANLPVHRTTRNVYNTLTALVRRTSDWPEAQLMHRLDQETAGIVLFAKNNDQAKLWQPKFHTLVTQKIYQAIVYGTPDWTELEVSNKLAVRGNSPIRCQMHVCRADEKGKASTTRFRVVQRMLGYSLIECELVTGRKHQIRAHLAHLGHAIVGDKIYAHQGEYYLHRLADSLTQEHQQQLLSPHQLLLAHRVTLQLSDDEQTAPVVIVDDHYPMAWQAFLAGLVDPLLVTTQTHFNDSKDLGMTNLSLSAADVFDVNFVALAADPDMSALAEGLAEFGRIDSQASFNAFCRASCTLWQNQVAHQYGASKAQFDELQARISEGAVTDSVIPTPWGGVVITRLAPPTVEKYLVVQRGGYLALETHSVKQEQIEVIEGRGLLLVGELGETELRVHALAPGDRYAFVPGMEHCLIGTEDLLIFERSNDPKGMDQDLIFLYTPEA